MKKPIPTPSKVVATAPVVPTAETAPVVPTIETAPAVPTTETAPAVPTTETAPVVPTTETAPVIWDELPRVVNVTHKDTGKAMTVSRAYYLAHAGKLNLA